MEEIHLIRNERRGQIVAAIVSAIVIYLFAINLFTVNPPETVQSVLIQFGEEDMGMNDDSDPFAEVPNFETPKEEVPKEVPKVVEPAVKDVVTDENSDVAIPKKKEIKKPVEKPVEKTTKPTTDKPVKETGNKSNEPKRPIGTFKKGDGKGTGDGGKTGPQGDPDGTGTSTTGGSVGNLIGGGLSGRKFDRHVPENNSSHFGTVVIEVCVNQDGKVIDASFTQKGSTTSVGALTELAESSARKFRFERNPDAPDKQCGTITFQFRPG
jgi:periplasmic protein TonB